MTINLNWYVPNLFKYDEYNYAFDDILKEFKIDNPLKYVYGIIRCNWAFNYDSEIKFNDTNQLNCFFNEYKKHKFIPILNFSKVNIPKEDLHDKFCNLLLDTFSDLNVEIIVASDVLFDYIKSRYPDIKIISSVNYPVFKFKNGDSYEEEFSFYNSLLSKFDKVILRPEFVNYLEKDFSFESKDKIILISNSACVSNCPYYSNCRNTDFIESLCPKDKCMNNSEMAYFMKSVNMLSNQQISQLNEQGYKNFMFVDNNESLTFLHPMYMEYILKNEEKIDIISNNIRYKTYSYKLKTADLKNKNFQFFGCAILYYSKIKEL